MRRLLAVLAAILLVGWLSSVSGSESAQAAAYDCGSVPITILQDSAECDALVGLYVETNGAAWATSTAWLTGNNPCVWYGVFCSGRHVRSLFLYQNNLSGELPTALGDLAELETLNLSGNQLVGDIPTRLGDLSKLNYLYLQENQLSGEIPSQLGDLTNLFNLELFSNQLVGDIPDLSQLTGLQRLYLDRNQLSGDIPDLSGLAALLELDLHGNLLTGSVPVLANSSNLKILRLRGNHLSGSIPASLKDRKGLVTLDLSSNQLSGEIPEGLGHLASLTALHLDHNALSGPIPSSFTGLKLEGFHFADTGLCVRQQVPFLAWLGSIADLSESGHVCGLTPDPGGPFSIDEGSSVPLDGSGSSNSESHPIVSFEWDLDGDGTFGDASGTSTSVTFDDNGAFTIGLAVETDEGFKAWTTTSVTVNNVAPTVDAGPDDEVNQGDTFSSAGRFTDPGADTWTATVDYGDGTGAQALSLNDDGTFALSHEYSGAGVFTTTVTVWDDDGGTGSDVAVVTVLATASIEHLMQVVTDGGFPDSLIAPLKVAEKLLADSNPDNDAGVCGKLGAFANQVRANKKVPLADKTGLIDEANEILAGLGCPHS